MYGTQKPFVGNALNVLMAWEGKPGLKKPSTLQLLPEPTGQGSASPAAPEAERRGRRVGAWAGTAHPAAAPLPPGNTRWFQLGGGSRSFLAAGGDIPRWEGELGQEGTFPGGRESRGMHSPDEILPTAGGVFQRDGSFER